MRFYHTSLQPYLFGENMVVWVVESPLLVFSRQHCRYNFFHVIKAVIIQNPHFESLINNLHDSFHIYLYLYTFDN